MKKLTHAVKHEFKQSQVIDDGILVDNNLVIYNELHVKIVRVIN